MANIPVFVVVTGMVVDGCDMKDFDDVGNVAPAVVMPVSGVVCTGADFTTIPMQPRCEC